MTKYWILIAPKNQVVRAIAEGYAQTGHGKAHPLKRMNVGDGFIYYSPKLEYGGEVQCQRFTAIGYVVGEKVYSVELTPTIKAARREVKYLMCTDAQIRPLIPNLTFIKDKQHWGNIFKFDIIQVQSNDFMLIAKALNTKVPSPV